MNIQRDCLLFDLDGTLVDSLPDLREALNQVLDEEGLTALSLEDVRFMVGDGANVLVERGFRARQAFDAQKAAQRRRRFLEIYETGAAILTKPYPNMQETVAALRQRGWRTAVCTNKPVEAARKVLDGLALSSLFDAVIGGGSTPALKPDPKPILAALEALGAGPQRGIMVGDNANDVEGARNAGLPSVVVGFGYTRIPAADLGADALIQDFSELPAALARLGFSL
jgi:phosphoglycolate phosphatase